MVSISVDGIHVAAESRTSVLLPTPESVEVHTVLTPRSNCRLGLRQNPISTKVGSGHVDLGIQRQLAHQLDSGRNRVVIEIEFRRVEIRERILSLWPKPKEEERSWNFQTIEAEIFATHSWVKLLVDK